MNALVVPDGEDEQEETIEPGVLSYDRVQKNWPHTYIHFTFADKLLFFQSA